MGTTVAAVLLGGLGCAPAPGILAVLALWIAAVLVPAAGAHVLGELLRLSLSLGLPLALSVALVNILFTPRGATLVAEVGPVRITDEGLALAAVVVVRVFTMAGAVVLFSLTTRPAALMASLQAHGASPRLAFVIHNAVSMVPRLAERAAEVAAAQRARGLDTEGSLARRARGVLALAAPTLLGAVAEAEARSLALETRAFTRPGPRTLLWTPVDGPLQRLARWSIVAAVGLLALVPFTGVAPSC